MEPMEELRQLIREGFQQLNERLAAVEQRQAALEQRQAAMEQRQAAMEQRQSAMEQRQDALQAYMLEFRSEVIQRLDQLETRLYMIALSVQSVDGRMPGIAKAIDNLQVRMTKFERVA
jgi:hypothetical protein